MKDSCPFCDFNEDRELKEGKYAFVIFSNPRVMPGHLLVIPKRHMGRLVELSDDERKELLDLVIEFQEKILKRLSKGCDIRQNFRPYVKNSRTHVNHLHFHLHPRNLNDEVHEKANVYNSLYTGLPEEEKEKLFELLKD